MQIPTFDGQALLNRLSQNSSVGFFVYNRELKICEWNTYMEKLTGLKRIDCLEKEMSAIFRTASPEIDKREIDKREFEEALHGKQFFKKKSFIIRSTGQITEKKFNFLIVPLDEPDNSIHFAAVIAIEKEEEKIKAAIGQQKTALRSLNSFLNYAPMPIFIIGKDFKVQLANEAFNYFFQVDNSIGQHLDDLQRTALFESGAMEQPKKKILKVIETEELDISHEQYKIDGQDQHFYVIRFPIRNGRGKIDAIGGYALEITEEVEQEQRIQNLLSETISLNEELEAQNQELVGSRERLEAANKALKLKRKKLRAAMKELSDRNFELDQIMYKTSHDLRSPLTSILGLLSLIKEEKDPAKLPEYLAYVEDRVEKLDSFVKSMLTYAKNSRMKLKAEEVDWQELINDSLSNLEYMANFKEVRVYTNLKGAENSFKSDLLRLKIIFNNLLGNAIKYADLRKPEPYIRIQVENLPEEAVISFQDNGIGIEKQYLPEIGKMFFRATEKSEGSGLGMYIVKQAVERLNGSMQLASKSGKGTTIRIQLPRL